MFEYIFIDVFDLDVDGGRSIVAKIGPSNAIDLARRRVKSENKATQNADLIEHFIEGFDLCTQNRNEVMHSELAYIVQEKAFFVKPSRKGEMIGSVFNIEDLRKFADSIKSFSIFGRAIINANGWPQFSQYIENASSISPFCKPDRPPLPLRMSFRAGPIPI